MHPSEQRPIRDFVLPMMELVFDGEGILSPDKSHLAGTLFLIGGNGYALTAAHVVDQTTDKNRCALVAYGDEKRTEWRGVKIEAYEKHPTEDVALLKLSAFPDGPRISYFRVPPDRESASLDYAMWAYPEVIAREVETHDLPAGFLQVRPDLVFFRGYIRRRMPFSPNPQFEMYRGSVFYELSEIGGSCCSGAPIVKSRSNPWAVVGIYVGEEMTNRRCGYAVSLEAVATWAPALLGRMIKEEADSTASMTA